jgi:hypothetical protein
MSNQFNTSAAFLETSIGDLRALKNKIEKAIDQLVWEDFRFVPDKESNNIAIIMKHISGNLISRWTDFLTSDGEKPTRHRDSEFIYDFTDRKELFNFWERGWNTLFESIDNLSPDDVSKTVLIRGEQHSVLKTIIRAHNHLSYHAGQIVYLSKHILKDKWKSLSVPRGKSEEFNKEMLNRNN